LPCLVSDRDTGTYITSSDLRIRKDTDTYVTT
jgi:hypothetical protein